MSLGSAKWLLFGRPLAGSVNGIAILAPNLSLAALLHDEYYTRHISTITAPEGKPLRYKT